MAKCSCQEKQKNAAIKGLPETVNIDNAKTVGIGILAGYAGYWLGDQADSFLLPSAEEREKLKEAEMKRKNLIAGGAKTVGAFAIGMMLQSPILKAMAIGLGVSGLSSLIGAAAVKGIEEDENMYWDAADTTTESNDILVNNRS